MPKERYQPVPFVDTAGLTRGEWLEYRICYPVDPLENSLLPSPLPPPPEPPPEAAKTPPPADDAKPAEEEYVYFRPMFEPPVAWREAPLRLEITQVDDNGCRAELLFEGLRHEAFFPNGTVERGARFTYEDPQPDDEERTVVLPE